MWEVAGSYLLGLAVGVEEGQAVQALVVLREAAQAEEEGAHAQLHQQAALLLRLGRQGLGDLHRLQGRGVRLLLAVAGRGRGGGRLGEGLLWRSDGDGCRRELGAGLRVGGYGGWDPWGVRGSGGSGGRGVGSRRGAAHGVRHALGDGVLLQDPRRSFQRALLSVGG